MFRRSVETAARIRAAASSARRTSARAPPRRFRARRRARPPGLHLPSLRGIALPLNESPDAPPIPASQAPASAPPASVPRFADLGLGAEILADLAVLKYERP